MLNPPFILPLSRSAVVFFFPRAKVPSAKRDNRRLGTRMAIRSQALFSSFACGERRREDSGNWETGLASEIQSFRLKRLANVLLKLRLIYTHGSLKHCQILVFCSVLNVRTPCWGCGKFAKLLILSLISFLSSEFVFATQTE